MLTIHNQSIIMYHTYLLVMNRLIGYLDFLVTIQTSYFHIFPRCLLITSVKISIGNHQASAWELAVLAVLVVLAVLARAGDELVGRPWGRFTLIKKKPRERKCGKFMVKLLKKMVVLLHASYFAVMTYQMRASVISESQYKSLVKTIPTYCVHNWFYHITSNLKLHIYQLIFKTHEHVAWILLYII